MSTSALHKEAFWYARGASDALDIYVDCVGFANAYVDYFNKVGALVNMRIGFAEYKATGTIKAGN